VRGNVAKADVLALTADNGKTLYTMGGLRWGAYQDIERRAPEYFLPPFWHKGKLMRAYMSAYLNGELDEPRKLLVKYAKDITEDEMAQHHQRELEKEQQIQMLTSQVKRSGFGFGRKPKVAEPIKQSDADHVKINELNCEKRVETAELDFAVDHHSSGHNVTLSTEQTIASFWTSMGQLLDRAQEYGRYEPISPFDQVKLSNFEVSQVHPLPTEDMDIDNDSTLSFFIDGEAYAPCKISGKLLISHIDIIRH